MKFDSPLWTRYWPPLWLALLAAYMLAGTPLAPFHGDESTLVYMSRDYVYLFFDHDLNKIRYSETPASPTEQHLRLLNGTVAKYLIGLAWHTGGFSPADINEQWDWGADWTYNQQNGHAPAPELLQTVRWSSALLLAAGVMPVFLLGQALGGRRVAVLASLYYALNPALLLNGRRAMMEGSLTFFSLLAVLAGVWFIRSLTPAEDSEKRRSWLPALVLGAASGLALASKHTAAFTAAAVFAACGGYAVYHWVKSPREMRRIRNIVFPQIIFAAMIAAAVFLALNPAWWGSPLVMPRVVLNLRAELLDIQINAFGGYGGFSDMLGGFFRQVFISLPQYYEVAGWENFIGDQIARYEASPWRGVSVGGSAVGGFALAVMMVFGAWALWRGRQKAGTGRLVVGAWTVSVVAATLLLTPLEWQRYYLPVYPAVGLLAALGVDELTRWILNRQDIRKARNAR